MGSKRPSEYRANIRASKLDIYAPIEIGDPRYWIPTLALESLLRSGLKGISLAGLPNRTRSKVVKTAVCKALGYPAPLSFRKTQPRFFGQQLDAYVQKSLNLQIWNEELSPTRRYAVIQVLADDTIGAVKVVNGQELALLDTTGKITTKYQAQLLRKESDRELISALDTAPMRRHVSVSCSISKSASPISDPVSGKLLPIAEIYSRLSMLIGSKFPDPGCNQERNRGAALHKLVCETLGYVRYEDKGQFPDIHHQLLEVKLQTSPTIDLGLVLPNSEDLVDIEAIDSHHPRHCDTRYALFYAEIESATVKLTHLFVTTGADFFTRFRRFEGNVVNRKIQIPLPRDFYAR